MQQQQQQPVAEVVDDLAVCSLADSVANINEKISNLELCINAFINFNEIQVDNLATAVNELVALKEFDIMQPFRLTEFEDRAQKLFTDDIRSLWFERRYTINVNPPVEKAVTYVGDKLFETIFKLRKLLINQIKFVTEVSFYHLTEFSVAQR
jgi:hypothetical protein